MTILVLLSRWALSNRHQLQQCKSDLEFKLHQRKYLSFLSAGMVNEAVTYAKVFGQFSTTHKKGE